MSARSKAFILDLLKQADIEVGGHRPWDIQIHDDRLFDRVIRQGTLGLGEGYMDGWWDAEAIDQFIFRVLRFDVRSAIRFDMAMVISTLRGLLFNNQRAHVYEVGERHYDIGNDLYEAMLDKRMIYSCGYWKNAKTLDEAQEAKLDLICRKAGLEPGMRVLDIGSGWGGFLRYAAEHYGIEGVGLTISREQAEYANANRGNLPIETRLADYLSMTGKFDRIISIGMFEHVGYKNYGAYMQKVRELLSDDGIFLLHSIGGNSTVRNGDPWAEKYIFPNGMLPSIRQLGAAIEGRFVMEDWHNFGGYYDPTLMAWLANFEAAWPRLKDKYGERFHRMWRYYLCSFAGGFRARALQLWQVVLIPDGRVGGYESIR